MHNDVSVSHCMRCCSHYRSEGTFFAHSNESCDYSLESCSNYVFVVV